MPDPAERYALLCATAHLTNLGHRGELTTLHERLYGTGDVNWLAYRLRFLDGRPPQDFTSYSLGYEAGDRLVTPAKEELRVVEIRDRDPAELVVEPWRPSS